ncbi:protein FAR1-RELATED SEQUENCE 5-like [Bidens hawaiensis]|uniref:protein FAR1-RELATED SEQUENCE 5-like n=1 Tax=Bidens hawaiensis TaxID=980011 RepID=UPI00404B5611
MEVSVTESISGSTSYSIDEVNSVIESVATSVLPNGQRSWIPFVPPEFKPYVGAKFRTLDEVVVMYEEYAEKAGFCTRLGTTKKRNDIITTRLVRGSSDYEIYGFVEEHNHGPHSSEQITKRKRKLDFATKEFISNCRLACVGPTKAFKLHVVLKGGHHNLQGTLTDYNNFGRDIRELIADGDAQMVIDKFNERAKNVKNFTFKSRVVGTELTSLFWVYNISKINYDAFGDVMAFDATYHTNMYDMISVPFNGIDHHKKSVVFGAGLLHNESVESYTWLLQMFLDTHGKQPTFVLTDQDPSMKQAVHSVLDKSIHRLCMWHVITKLSLKKKMEKSLRLCYIVSREELDVIHSYLVAHQDHSKKIVKEYKVTFDTSNFTVTCECMGFTRIGYLCRHVFCIYRHQGIDKIPMKYVSLRWCRDALPSGVYCMENSRGVTIPDEETGDTSTEEDTDEDTDEICKEGTDGESNGEETDKDI